MNDAYLFEKEPMSKHNINLGSTILGRFGAIILLGLTVLSFAGCGGGGGSDSGSSMQIRPPSSRDGADLVVLSLRLFPERSVLQGGEPITLSAQVRNQGNERAPQAAVFFIGLDAQGAREVILDDVFVRSLDPSEVAIIELNWRAPGVAATDTFGYEACVGLSQAEIYDCSDPLFVTVMSRLEGGSGGGGGGSGGGEPVTVVWPCPFSSGSITVPNLGQAVKSAEIRFQGGSCGNFWVSDAPLGSSLILADSGVIRFGAGSDNGRRIIFASTNLSGQTRIRQYTVYFCSKNNVSNAAFCGRGRESSTGTLTVNWLSGEPLF